MSVLNPTPRARMCDGAGRPYFLWDTELTLEQIGELWPEVQHDLGRTREFWGWILRQWGVVA